MSANGCPKCGFKTRRNAQIRNCTELGSPMDWRRLTLRNEQWLKRCNSKCTVCSISTSVCSLANNLLTWYCLNPMMGLLGFKSLPHPCVQSVHQRGLLPRQQARLPSIRYNYWVRCSSSFKIHFKTKSPGHRSRKFGNSQPSPKIFGLFCMLGSVKFWGEYWYFLNDWWVFLKFWLVCIFLFFIQKPKFFYINQLWEYQNQISRWNYLIYDTGEMTFYDFWMIFWRSDGRADGREPHGSPTATHGRTDGRANGRKSGSFHSASRRIYL